MANKDDEEFELVDGTGGVVGRELRHIVHKKGTKWPVMQLHWLALPAVARPTALVCIGHAAQPPCIAQTCLHAGLLHRAVYVWVFNLEGALLIQRRSPHKKIGPNQLDLSVAEHLQPGESFVQGAARGLAEELGISVSLDELQGPLAPTHRRELHQGDFHDCELVQSFRHASAREHVCSSSCLPHGY
jgi:hypothetical protein